MSDDVLKKQAALYATQFVKSGMLIGLGTGSTSFFAIQRIGELWQKKQLLDICCIPTSEQSAKLAQKFTLPIRELLKNDRIDLAIDGADEVDPQLNLIKGLGGAILQEKRVEKRALRFIVIVDESKLVSRLGSRAPLPIEINPDTCSESQQFLNTLGCEAKLRQKETPFVSDNSNFIIDCYFSDGINNAAHLATCLDNSPLVLAHGLFLNMATKVIVATSSGIQVKHR